MQVNMLEAKTKLSKLVEAVERGEEVVIARNGFPVAQLVPVAKQKLPFGFLKDEVGPTDDRLLFAMTDEQAGRFIEGEDW